MAEGLAQPGCFFNTSPDPGSKRGVMTIDIPRVENPYAKRIRTQRGWIPAMRGQIRKVGKKKPNKKSGKKIQGRGGAILQFGQKTSKTPLKSPHETVNMALRLLRRRSEGFASTPNPGLMKALSYVRDRYPQLAKRVPMEGHVPGVGVGDVFRSRAELCLVNLHAPPQAGIGCKKGKDGASIAVSVVVSGGYEDDIDQGETLIYTGEGGNDLNGTRKQCEDQQMKGGNLALHNSLIWKKPVRVIRGRLDDCKLEKYSYDGLYKVVKTTKEPGLSGFKVYKFTLVREPGQSSLKWTAPVTSPRDSPRCRW